ncbi:MAG: desulfoferrodoxin family protein [Holdemania filiformis]
MRHLTPADAPKAVFEIGEGKPLAVYEYCNLHGLWKTEL